MKHKKVEEPLENENKEREEEIDNREPSENIVEKEDCNDKIAEINDKYLRLAAEFDNYRRRTAKERMELVLTAAEDTIKGMLPILDDCERALEILKQSKVSEAAIEGTELIYSKLYGYLKTRGLTQMECLGKELDTDFHDAVAKLPIEDESKTKNVIVEIVQQGYLLNGKVIRFAKVVVGV